MFSYFVVHNEHIMSHFAHKYVSLHLSLWVHESYLSVAFTVPLGVQ